MKRLVVVSCVVVLGLAAVGCGGGSPSGGGSTTPPPDGVSVGNAAVLRRIATVPVAPVAPTTQMSAITTADATALCPWVVANVSPNDMEQECPPDPDVPADQQPSRTTVRARGGCEPEGLVALAAQFAEAQCSLNVAEFFACQLAIRADPCGGGAFGANHAECEAMTDCIRASFARAQAAQSAQVPAEETTNEQPAQ